jgi:hypothetical protein
MSENVTKGLWKDSTDTDTDGESEVPDSINLALMIFLIVSLFTVPSILVMLYMKPTAGYQALEVVGWYSLVLTAMVGLLILASLSAIVYVVRGIKTGSRNGRLAVLVTLVLLWASYGYIIS